MLLYHNICHDILNVIHNYSDKITNIKLSDAPKHIDADISYHLFVIKEIVSENTLNNLKKELTEYLLSKPYIMQVFFSNDFLNIKVNYYYILSDNSHQNSLTANNYEITLLEDIKPTLIFKDFLHKVIKLYHSLSAYNNFSDNIYVSYHRKIDNGFYQHHNINMHAIIELQKLATIVSFSEKKYSICSNNKIIKNADNPVFCLIYTYNLVLRHKEEYKQYQKKDFKNLLFNNLFIVELNVVEKYLKHLQSLSSVIEKFLLGYDISKLLDYIFLFCKNLYMDLHDFKFFKIKTLYSSDSLCSILFKFFDVIESILYCFLDMLCIDKRVFILK